MDSYSAFLTLTDRQCLVVGASLEALGKARDLSRCGARVHLVDPAAAAEVPGVAFSANRLFQLDDLTGCWLVIAASADAALNDRISSLCHDRQLLCHVVGNHDASSLIVPEVIDRSPMLIAITSGGGSPTLSRALKSRIESLVPTAYAKLAALVENYRADVKNRLPAEADRVEFWHSLINGPIGELAFNAKADVLEQAVKAAVSSINLSEPSAVNTVGHVALVGAGPGDPDLLTFRALRLVKSADAVVFDRLVSRSILDLCRSDAELIYAGKAKAAHTLPQDSINQLLVDLAKQGKQVVRLKGGDPFIFGRGGEEIETLADNGIGFQVVPGITAAAGCAAFGGIPLTHRDHAQSCVFVTGHLRNGQFNLNWQDLQDPTQTIVIYMGLTGLDQICQSLVEHGRAADTPAALIEHGTTPTQRVITATLATLASTIAASDVSAPTLLIIGSVVTLREKLDWFKPDTSETRDSRWHFQGE
ncbi:MAG: siroheme synthase CysG [Granulosicoccus sp.]